MNPENRKVKYTRRVIKEAYCNLLKEKPIDKISVAEICTLADVHRGTFYQHYHDIYDLQEKIEDELMEKFDEMMPAIESGQYDISEAVISSVFEEREICRAILGENGSADFLIKVIEKSRKSSYVKYAALGFDKKDFNGVFIYLTSGCIGVIRDWIMRDYNESPEYVIKMIRRISESCIKNI